MSAHRVVGNGAKKIYLFGVGMGNVFCGRAISEDGDMLASHTSSTESWLIHDLGITTDWHHDKYAQKYPDGFELIWVAQFELESHLELNRALERYEAKQQTHNGDGA